MTSNDAIALLRSKVDEYGSGGKARAARELGYSPTVITQILNVPITYSGNVDNVAQRIIEVYGNLTCDCPILGDIPLARCADERRKGFSTSRVELWKTCRTCERRAR